MLHYPDAEVERLLVALSSIAISWSQMKESQVSDRKFQEVNVKSVCRDMIS